MPKIVARALTVLEVKGIKKVGFTAVGGAPGLYLLVKNSGARYFVYRYQTTDGRRSMISLGSTQLLDLAKARKLALEWKEKVRQGQVPALIRKTKREKIKQERIAKMQEFVRQQNCFSMVADDWITERSLSGYWKNNSVGESKTQSYLNLYICPSLGDIPISDLSPKHVFEMIRPIYQSKPNTSEKCLTVISSVWKWAKARDLCDGENPADRKGTLGVLLEPYKNDRKGKVNFPALDFNDIPEFMKALHAKNTISARLTEFTILTALRSKMVRFAKWEDLNFKKKTLTVKESSIKTKGRGSHTVFLSTQAIDLLKSLKPTGEFIFPTKSKDAPMSDAAMGKVIRDLHQESLEEGGRGWIDPVQSKEKHETIIATIHGTARATFKTWARSGENRKILDDDAVELCLAHNLKDDYDGAYNRATLENERRQIMQAWGDFCYSKS